jgi:hypothetical protein
MRPAAAILIGALIALADSGCKQSSPPIEEHVAPPPPTPVYHTLARLHWVGKNRLSADPNASNVLTIWSLPETTKLRDYFLNKLAAGLCRVAGSGLSSDTNAPIPLLRPLLDDLVEQESWMELRQASNNAAEVMLAVRLNEAQANSWRTNLASVLEGLTGSAPALRTNGWALQVQGGSNLVEFARAGDWSLACLSRTESGFVPQLSERIKERGSPVTLDSTNVWVEADLNLRRLGGLLAPTGAFAAFPSLSLSIAGESENVRTRGQLTFPGPLRFQFDDWQVPTNIIQQPLIGFTAVRGFGPGLSTVPFWKHLQAGPAPDQAFVWTLRGMPFLTYAITPLVEGSNTVTSFTQYLLSNANSWMSTNAFGRLAGTTNSDELSWIEVPLISPFTKLVRAEDRDYALAGLVGIPLQRSIFPSPLLEELGQHTNLVCYDWELTGERVESVLSSSQILRFLFRKSQLPTDSVVVTWSKAIAPRLGNCATAVTQVAPDSLSFRRRSTIGFSSLELNLLADWVESPDFPFGLYTTRGTNALSPNRIRPGLLTPKKAAKTNTPPQEP